MMSPAAITPAKIAGIACFHFRRNTAATSAPVHAPVPGSGIAKRTNSPKAAYFSRTSIFDSARA